MGTKKSESNRSTLGARGIASSVVVLCVLALTAGCASETEGPAPFGTNGNGGGSKNGAGQQPGETTDGTGSEESFDAEPGAEDIEEIPTTATSIEEWLQLEELAGDEYVALFGDPNASGGGLQQQGFVGQLGKMFKGVGFSIGAMPTAPTGFIKVGSFLPKPGEAYQGSLFADRLPFGLGSMLEPLAAKLIAAVQIQGSVLKFASLPKVDAAQGARLAKLFGGSASNYRIATPPPFIFESSSTSSVRVFVNTAGPTPKAVEFTQITTTGAKKTRLQVPR